MIHRSRRLCDEENTMNGVLVSCFFTLCVSLYIILTIYEYIYIYYIVYNCKCISSRYDVWQVMLHTTMRTWYSASEASTDHREDLDENGLCTHTAYISSSDATTPPMGAWAWTRIGSTQMRVAWHAERHWKEKLGQFLRFTPNQCLSCSDCIYIDIIWFQ